MSDLDQCYCSVAEVRQGIDKEVANKDAWLEVLIQSAKDAIDNYCHRPDGFKANGQAQARLFAGSGDAVQNIDECARIGLVEVKDSPSDSTFVVWASGDWIGGRGEPFVRPAFGDRDNRPYQWIMVDPTGDRNYFTSGKIGGLRGFDPGESDTLTNVPTVRVTANWGYSMSTPPAVKQASIVQVARWYQRGKSGWSDVATAPDFGVQSFRRLFNTLDADVAMILDMGGLVVPVIY